MSDTEDDDKYRAPALSKGLDILELLASEPDGLSQAEIAKTLGRTTSEIFRMLMVLRKRGYVRLEDSDRYSLTTMLFEMAHRHPPIRRLTSISGKAMQALADRINQSMHMGILHSGRFLVIAQVDCPDNNVTSVRLGANIPIFDTASGRVLAAWMDEAQLDALIASADATDEATRQAFRADLAEVRAKGYCENDSLTIAGVRNISAPIFDFSGKVVAAVTIPFIRRLSGTSIAPVEDCRDELLAMCRDISRRLGAGAYLDA
ncbi:IclR family transcriptional regulator [Pseudoprimorskyibacter insulae]|uniref:Transcriptional regulator KdgR n=1 Tax=Pseudoprimorskyibacter insulae TaxID=1695997 RepID=A0A2R8AZX7_9RHOB|nr:IclR family transcriptional regulator [Pseudoprimorskyibacter insulae]SPF81595.1 Transcriptional regulator KdgR [Pseudoprimorskyibacter insulae]